MACPIIPHPITEFKAAAVAKLGEKFEDGDGNTYRYVQYKDAVTYVAGMACWWDDHNTFAVTNDESSAEDDDFMAGICPGVPTENYYGLLQTGGLYPNAKKLPGQDTIAAGTILVADYITPTDGVLIPYTGAASTAGAPTNEELLLLLKSGAGFCVASDLSDDTNDLVDVEIYCETK